jgi:hypothetical protein
MNPLRHLDELLLDYVYQRIANFGYKTLYVLPQRLALWSLNAMLPAVLPSQYLHWYASQSTLQETVLLSGLQTLVWLYIYKITAPVFQAEEQHSSTHRNSRRLQWIRRIIVLCISLSYIVLTSHTAVLPLATLLEWIYMLLFASVYYFAACDRPPDPPLKYVPQAT